MQVGQRRISGSEVVHRDTDPERLQPPQYRKRTRVIAHQHVFCDFQLKPLRRQARFEQDGVYQSRQIAMLELHW